MELSIEKMIDELIKLAYERRDKTYDITMTKEEKEEKLKDLYEERDYIKKIQAPDIEDITNSFKWQKVQAEIYGLKMGCMDPNLCRLVLKYKIAPSEEVEFEYVQKMADGEIEFDEDVLKHYIKYSINEDFVIRNKELAYWYCQTYNNTDCISEELLGDREFLEKILENNMDEVNLPETFKSDVDILEKYFMCVEYPDISGINIETLNNERVAKAIEERYGETPNTLVLNDMAKKIKKTRAVVTHFGDDLDNKAAIEAIQRWGEDNDYIRIGQPLKVLRIPAGQVKEGMLNVDTGGHKGSWINKEQYSDTIIIDGDTEHGVKSACEALSRLGIYVPEQIVELADKKSKDVSSLDSRSGLALIRYLTGSQIFELAERNLLDKSLTDEQLEEFGLIKAHEKQQEIIDNAVVKIKEYTKELPNGEKVVVAPEQILAGSSIAYEMGINYYVSVSNHSDNEGRTDGVTFAITCKPGIQLPEEILEYGRRLAETYRTGKDTSNVFVNPNNEMIIAGGFKNPEFRIADETVESMTNKILMIFQKEEKIKGE